MSDLPGGFSCAFFVGRTLEMLCFNANQVYLHFGGGTHLQVDLAYSVSVAGQEALRMDVPNVNNDLFKLIERTVTNAAGSPDGELTLEFDNGLIFRCYEGGLGDSYAIRHGGHETYF